VPIESYVRLESLAKSQKNAPVVRSLTRDEKILLLPKKTKKSTQKKVKTGRVSKKGKEKFQMKINAFFKSDRASPDSGISSRPITPEEDSLQDFDEYNDETEIESQNAAIANKDFIRELEEDDSDNDSMSSEEEHSDWDDDSAPNWSTNKRKKSCQNNYKQAKIEIKGPAIKSEYELKREKAIKEKEKMLAALKAQWDNYKAATRPVVVAKPRHSTGTPRVKLIENGEVRRSSRSSGVKVEYCELKESTPTRERGTGFTFNENEFRFTQREKGSSGAKRSSINPNVDILHPDDVTQSMINRIHHSGRKEYCPTSGTCCHQCRQKTIDTKTVCRSGHCSGYRGLFCGSCLLMRYGESVAEALKDPEWKCPPCRKICNCSFCLETPTGQLYRLAKHKGHQSVHHYLQALRAKWDDDIGGDKADTSEEEAEKEENLMDE